MNSNNKSTVKTVLSVVIALLAIVLVVGLVLKFTSAGEKLKDLVNTDFRVEYDGKDYYGDDNVITLPPSGQAKFKVKGADSYKIKFMPNVTDGTDFTYEADGEVYAFNQANLAKVFITDESVTDGYFVIDCNQDLTLTGVLSKIHGGAEVTLNGKVDYPYLLTFNSGNKKVEFMFVVEIKVDLSEDSIIFLGGSE